MYTSKTYALAKTAQAKLAQEAGRSDPNIRRLVGHANLLDLLMVELDSAEQEQESWSSDSVARVTKSEECHIRCVEITDEDDEDWEDSDSDSDNSSDSSVETDDGMEMFDVDLLEDARSIKIALQSRRVGMKEDYESGEGQDFAQLELVRHSLSVSSPPELDHDSDSSDDESMPPPPQAVLSFSEKGAKEGTSQPESFDSDAFYVPPKNPARLISLISDWWTSTL